MDTFHWIACDGIAPRRVTEYAYQSTASPLQGLSLSRLSRALHEVLGRSYS
jgi:hypothetical protein